jgi:DegV family protein with EDD domain
MKMGRVAVVTDSAACLPPALVQAYGIHVIPFGLIWSGEILRDGVDITPAEFYRRMRVASELPSTSQPTLGDFLTVYEALAQEVEGIVSIHIPQTMSGTVSTAHAAAHLLPQVPIRVVDCGTAVMAQGFVVLAAARAAAAGARLEEVVAAAESMIPKVRLYATLENLEYLARSGRVPAAAALVGSVLQIQPVFTLHQGRVDVVARVRTKARAIAYIMDQMASEGGNRHVHVAVFHADIPDEAEMLRRQVEERFRCAELYLTEFTPVMGAHTGPGVLGVAFFHGEGPSS